jgi:hypothetical protein
MTGTSELIIASTAGSVVIVPIVAALKKAGVPSKFAPLASVLVGLAAGLVYALTTGNLPLWEGIVAGILSGATASGLYDNAKTYIQPTEDILPTPPSDQTAG